VLERCREEMPPLALVEDVGHRAACWNPVPS
jgi:hypothetical protein